MLKYYCSGPCVRNTSVKHVKFTQADSGRLPMKQSSRLLTLYLNWVQPHAGSSSFLVNRPWVSEIHLNFTRRFKKDFNETTIYNIFKMMFLKLNKNDLSCSLAASVTLLASAWVALSLSEEQYAFYTMYRQCSIVFIFDLSVLEVYQICLMLVS